MVVNSTLILTFIFEILLIYEIQTLASTTVDKTYNWIVIFSSRFLWKGTRLATEIRNAFKNMTDDFSGQIGDKASLVKFLLDAYLLSNIYPRYTWSCIMALVLSYSPCRESPLGSDSKGRSLSDLFCLVVLISPHIISRCDL